MNYCRALLGIAGVFFSFSIQGQVSKYTVTLDTNLSSASSDYAPRYLDTNGQSLIFTSTRGEKRDKMFYTTFQDNSWTLPTSIVATNDDNSNYGVVSFDTYRKVIFFTRCFNRRNVSMKCKVYYSFMQGDLIGEQFPLEIEINGDTDNNSFTFGHPYFSNELNILFFVSDMPGGYGGKDIWFSKYDRKTDSWSKPQNAGPDVNSDKDEFFPSISSEGTLYFSSDGHGGYGGLDIFKASKIGELKWGNVENMGQPINSDSDDFAIVFKPHSRSGFLSSNRKGGIGSYDIYSFSPQNNSQVENQFSFPIINDSVENVKRNALIEVLNRPACTSNIDSLQITEAKVYPNPNKGEFTFECVSNKNINLTLRIYTSLGKVVSTEPINLCFGKFSKQYNLQNKSKGIYYVQLLYNCESLQTVKVIID